MVDYGAAFRLPFSNLKRSGILFFALLLASLAGQMADFVVYGNSPYAGPHPAFTAERVAVALLLYLFLIIISAFVSGYSFRIMGSAARGQNLMPPFDNSLGLLGRGLQYFAATLIFLILSAFAAVFAIALAALFGGAAAMIIRLLLLLPLLIFMLLFFAYIMPMLLASFAHEKAFGALFAIRKAFRYAFSTAYFVPWLAGVAYMIAASVAFLIIYLPVTFISLSVQFASFILVPFTALYSIISTTTIMSLYGQAYHDVAGAKAAAAAPAQAKPRRHAKK